MPTAAKNSRNPTRPTANGPSRRSASTASAVTNPHSAIVSKPNARTSHASEGFPRRIRSGWASRTPRAEMRVHRCGASRGCADPTSLVRIVPRSPETGHPCKSRGVPEPGSVLSHATVTYGSPAGRGLPSAGGLVRRPTGVVGWSGDRRTSAGGWRSVGRRRAGRWRGRPGVGRRRPHRRDGGTAGPGDRGRCDEVSRCVPIDRVVVDHDDPPLWRKIATVRLAPGEICVTPCGDTLKSRPATSGRRYRLAAGAWSASVGTAGAGQQEPHGDAPNVDGGDFEGQRAV